MPADAIEDRVSQPTGRVRQWRRWLRLGVLLAVLLVLVLSLRPDPMHRLLSEGQQELQQDNLSAALACFEEAHQLDPDAAEPHFWMARVRRKLGDFDAVRTELDAAQRSGYHDVDRLRREWWLVLAEAGHLNRVESRLPGLLQNSDDNAEVCEAFTTGYCLHLRFGEAEALLDAWQADYPDDYRPYLRRGQIYASLEAWSQAEQAFQEALQRGPNVARIHRELAEAFLHLGRLEEADEHIRIVLAGDADNVQALSTSAEILMELKQYSAAEEQLRRLLEVSPGEFAPRLSLAKVLLAAGRPADAVQEAEQLAREWPEDLETIYTLAQALRAAGRPQKAEMHFERYAELAHVLAELEQLKTAVNANPGDPQLRYELGCLLLRHVSREDGVAYLQSVLLYEPQHAEAHQVLADYYLRCGDTDIAARHQEFAAPPETRDP